MALKRFAAGISRGRNAPMLAQARHKAAMADVNLKMNKINAGLGILNTIGAGIAAYGGEKEKIERMRGLGATFDEENMGWLDVLRGDVSPTGVQLDAKIPKGFKKFMEINPAVSDISDTGFATFKEGAEFKNFESIISGMQEQASQAAMFFGGAQDEAISELPVSPLTSEEAGGNVAISKYNIENRELTNTELFLKMDPENRNLDEYGNWQHDRNRPGYIDNIPWVEE